MFLNDVISIPSESFLIPTQFPRVVFPLQVNGIKDARVPISVLLPHEVLHALASCDAAVVFKAIMYGGMSQNDVKKFWAHIKTLPPWATHPCLCFGDLSKTIAVQLHADGAEMFRDDEYYCFSWSSAFSSFSGLISDVMLTRFPIMIVAERHMQQPEVSYLGNWFFMFIF